MNLGEFQRSSEETIAPGEISDLLYQRDRLVEFVLGLADESLELLAETVKDSETETLDLVGELGDVIRYLAMFSVMMRIDLAAFGVPLEMTPEAVLTLLPAFQDQVVSLCAEVRHLTGPIKKFAYHQKPLSQDDVVGSVKRVLVLWVGACHSAGIPPTYVMSQNIQKIRRRRSR